MNSEIQWIKCYWLELNAAFNLGVLKEWSFNGMLVFQQKIWSCALCKFWIINEKKKGLMRWTEALFFLGYDNSVTISRTP